MRRERFIAGILTLLMVFGSFPYAVSGVDDDLLDGALDIEITQDLETDIDEDKASDIEEGVNNDIDSDLDVLDDVDLDAVEKDNVDNSKGAAFANISKDKAKIDNKVHYKAGEVIVMYDVEGQNSKKASKEILGEDITIKDSLNLGRPERLNIENENVASFEFASRKASISTKRRMVSLISSKKYSTKQLLKRYKNNKNVLAVEPNYIVKASAKNSFADINDTLKNHQWALNNTGQNGGKAGEDIKIDSAWSKATGTEKVVAIIDTGIDLNHEELKDRLWTNTNTRELVGLHGYDFANDDSNPQDDNGHGTHVAGIIGAATDNAKGISGVNQNIKFMALKFLDGGGSGDTFDALSAYNYIYKAQEMGVDIVAINNSWGGGIDEEEDGEDSILKYLIDLVGKNGAISLCASGNESSDTDVVGNSPSGIDSDYIVSVAASNEKGVLADFSNYGEETVDVAAPGTDILSSVSYPCYNPSIYNADGLNNQANASEKYESFNGTSLGNGITVSDVSSSALHDKTSVNTNCSVEYYGTNAGKSVQYKITNADMGEIYKLAFRYNANDGNDVAKKIKDSFLIKTKNTPCFADFYSSLYAIEDVPYSALDSIQPSESNLYGGTNGTSDDWGHVEIERSAGKSNDRCLVFMLVVMSGGDFEFYFDDFGVSKPYKDEEEAANLFGKYDIYSGTSMATPYVTGYAAMITETMGFGNGKTRDALSLVDTIKASTRDLTEKSYTSSGTEMTIGKGQIDFSYADESKTSPVIKSINKISGKDNISIKGNLFGNVQGSSKVSIIVEEKELTPNIIKWSNKEIVISSKVGNINLVNKYVTLIVERNGRKDSKKLLLKAAIDNYKVVANKDALETDDYIDNDKSIIATDGNDLYVFATNGEGGDSEEDFYDELLFDDEEDYEDEEYYASSGFYKLRKKNSVYDELKGWQELAAPEVSKLFKKSEYSYDDYIDIQGGFAYLNGYFYAVANKTTGYSNEYKIIRYEIAKNKWSVFCNLPTDTEARGYTHSTLASYNGSLYLVGGYNVDERKASTMVRKLNVSTKKWSGANDSNMQLPSARYNSSVRQVGKYLVAAFGGNTEQTVPKIAIYDGKKWVEDPREFNVLTHSSILYPSDTPTDIYETDWMTDEIVYYEEQKFYNMQMGITGKNTIIFTGNDVIDYGDTFKYTINSVSNLSKNTLAGTNYSSVKSNKDKVLAQSVGNKFYLLQDKNENSSYKLKYMPITSANLTVKANIKGNGSIVGAGGYLPGQTIKLSAVGKKNKTYPISFSVDGKKQRKYNYIGKVYMKDITKTSMTATASFNNYIKRLSLSKKKASLNVGSSLTLKVKYNPNKMIKKQVKWISSNNSVATVNSFGKVVAKKKGTAVITVMSLDGKKAKAKCTIKVK